MTVWRYFAHYLKGCLPSAFDRLKYHFNLSSPVGGQMKKAAFLVPLADLPVLYTISFTSGQYMSQLQRYDITEILLTGAINSVHNNRAATESVFSEGTWKARLKTTNTLLFRLHQGRTYYALWFFLFCHLCKVCFQNINSINGYAWKKRIVILRQQVRSFRIPE